jgi:hypothetical protein
MKKFYLVAILLWSFACYSQDFDGCFASGTKPSDDYHLFETSGNLSLDQYVGREVRVLRQFYGVDPSFWFYHENPGSAPNAFAEPEAVTTTHPGGTVCFSIEIIQQQYMNGNGNTSIPIIMSHEFGHLLDFKYHATSLRGMYKELFADFQAGCFLFYRGVFITTDVNAAILSFFRLGDYQFNEPGHHGTPQQRIDALMAGYTWLRSVSRPGVSINATDGIAAAKSYLSRAGIDDEGGYQASSSARNRNGSSENPSEGEVGLDWLNKVIDGRSDCFSDIKGDIRPDGKSYLMELNTPSYVSRKKISERSNRCFANIDLFETNDKGMLASNLERAKDMVVKSLKSLGIAFTIAFDKDPDGENSYDITLTGEDSRASGIIVGQLIAPELDYKYWIDITVRGKLD